MQRLHAEVQRLRAEGQRSESLSSELEKLQLLPRPGPPPGLPRWRFGPDTVWDRPVRKHCSEIALGTWEFGAGIVTFERDEIRWTFSMPDSHSSHCTASSRTLKLRTASLCSASASDIDFDLSLRGFVDVPVDLRGYDLNWETCLFPAPMDFNLNDHYDPFSQPGARHSAMRPARQHTRPAPSDAPFLLLRRLGQELHPPPVRQQQRPPRGARGCAEDSRNSPTNNYDGRLWRLLLGALPPARAR